MRILAFVGPSLPSADRTAFSGVEWLPPCGAGDLLRLDVEKGAALCLIDGWFDHRPAVRHKEILEMLSRGVRVLGAASIGALRAAEMAPFGMEGIGAIYRAYARGAICGDDEVALVHGPAEWDWRALSVPLVDVRATCHAGLRRRVMERAQAAAVLESARRIHYVDRSWPEAISAALLPKGEAKRIGDWVAAHRVAQKRIDARACIRAAYLPGPARPKVTPIRTVFLEALAKACSVRLPPP